MKKLLFFLVVVGVIAWFVDSSGVGFARTVDADPGWKQQIIVKNPTAMYIKYKNADYLLTSPDDVGAAIDIFAQRQSQRRYSLFGRPLPEPNEKKANQVWVKYENKPFEKVLDFGDPLTDVGKPATDYLDGLNNHASAPPAGFVVTNSSPE